MTVPPGFPFTRLRMHSGENVLWSGYNPTFHRFLDYGLVLSDRALYLCRRSWWRLALWKRFPLDIIDEFVLLDGGGRPGVRIRTATRNITFRTPFDFYADEMEFDRMVLEKAVAAVGAAKSAVNT